MDEALRTACKRAIHLRLADGTILRGGRAALATLSLLGWRWTARILGWPPMVWAVELGYRIVAGNRPFFARFLFTRR